jgi:hypothetical protein
MWNTGDHLVASSSFAGDNLRCRWSYWAESFSNNDSNWYTLCSSTTNFLKDNLKMSWSSDIQEVLLVSAPKLIFLSFLINSSSTSSGLRPLIFKLLLNCVWHLD